MEINIVNQGTVQGLGQGPPFRLALKGIPYLTELCVPYSIAAQTQDIPPSHPFHHRKTPCQ